MKIIKVRGDDKVFVGIGDGTDVRHGVRFPSILYSSSITYHQSMIVMGVQEQHIKQDQPVEPVNPEFSLNKHYHKPLLRIN
jgi:hypothetical protein